MVVEDKPTEFSCMQHFHECYQFHNNVIISQSHSRWGYSQYMYVDYILCMNMVKCSCVCICECEPIYIYIYIPYSWKYWRELNLAVEPKIAKYYKNIGGFTFGSSVRDRHTYICE